jgi:hypothetical protein
MKLPTSLALGAAGACLALSASAHHSFAMFDKSKTITITGTIQKLEWVNPHVWIWINVPDDKGNTAVYGLETGGTGMLRRMGLPREKFKAGDKVIMQLHPLTSGEKGGEWVGGTLGDGTTLNVMDRIKIYSSGGPAAN